MDAHSSGDFSQQVRRYLYVFYALLFGTVVTVGASYIPFGNHAVNVGVALAIACGKASLVAGFANVLFWKSMSDFGKLSSPNAILRYTLFASAFVTSPSWT